MSRMLIVAAGLLIVLGVGWRLYATWRIRTYLIGLLSSADPATRAGTLTLVVAEGIEHFAPALRYMSETEKDPLVLTALMEAVNRTQVMPARSPELISLRLWAASRQAEALLAPPSPRVPDFIPIEGIVINNATAIDDGTRRQELAPSARGAIGVHPTAFPADLLAPVAVARTNGTSASHAPMPSATGRLAAGSYSDPPGLAAEPYRDPAGLPADDPHVVLVTGAGGPAGVAVIRALRRAGHRVVACDADAYAVGFRLADEFARVPRADDPAFADAVIKAVARSGASALISTVAEELGPLHMAAGPIAEAGAATWLPDPWSVQHCVDKWQFHELMTENGIPVPATGRSSERGVPGPWIIKPRFGRGSRDVYDAANADDLRYALNRASEPLVQTKVNGREFTVDTLSGAGGPLLGAVPRWRLETKAGISTKGITFDDPDLVRKIAELLGVLRLAGPACVQGFRTDDGQLVFIEVNPRFSGGLPLSLAAAPISSASTSSGSSAAMCNRKS